MSRKMRIWLIAVGSGLVALVAMILLGLYLALRYEPPFYRQAMTIDRAVLEKGSDRMLQRATRLANDVRKRKHWEAVFTADEVNGWLAVDRMKNHPYTLPPAFRDPRVAIDSTQITLACRCTYNGIDCVLSLTVEPSLPKPNVLALKIVSARAGLLPLPLSRVLDKLKQSAVGIGLDLKWQREGSDPVALLTLPKTDGDRTRIETLQLGEGKVYVSGSTEKR